MATLTFSPVGLWRSLVARSVRVGEVAGSNPVSPISVLPRGADTYGVDQELVPRQAVARVWSVTLFLGAALISLFAAMADEAEEAYITWGSPNVVGLLVFAAGNLVAAGLAARPGRSMTMRALGTLSLAPAVLLMNEYSGSSSDSKWVLLVGAVALVVAGGLIAGRGATTSAGA
jgi:hypothetical protein